MTPRHKSVPNSLFTTYLTKVVRRIVAFHCALIVHSERKASPVGGSSPAAPFSISGGTHPAGLGGETMKIRTSSRSWRTSAALLAAAAFFQGQLIATAQAAHKRPVAHAQAPSAPAHVTPP